MPQHALVRVRRLQPKEPVLRLIAFQLRQHWFCLPLARARRVLSQQTVRADLDQEMGLIQLQNETIPIVDTASLVFEASPRLPGSGGAPSNPPPAPVTSSILVVDLSQGGAVGLLIDGTPTIKRVRQSALRPVPQMYLTINHLRGINGVVDLTQSTSADHSSQLLLLLEMDALLPPSPSP
ncbi:MAG: chemotaxis protein CheW [Leptolyngbya sp. SIO1E4]|nr:chemotaxis protein CheW [Leptolyngbya sp. SIO1E4]